MRGLSTQPRPLLAPARTRATARFVSWPLVGLGVVLAGAVLLQLAAVVSGYPLRVTGDVPVFLALIKDMAAHPLAHQSPFLNAPGVASPHGTPYMLLLALLYRAIAPARSLGDPIAEGRFLGEVGIVVSLATLLTVACFARRIAGPRAGALTVPVLLVLFGPAHVIWASDLTFHGLMYAGFYPQNVAITLALWALMAMSIPGLRGSLLTGGFAGAAMIVHPLTGSLVCGLGCVESCRRAWLGEPGYYRPSLAIACGFFVAQAWPGYPLSEAMSESVLTGTRLVVACALLPELVAVIAPHVRTPEGALRALRTLGVRLTGERAQARLAVGGMLVVLALAAWQVVLLAQPISDPLIHSNRLAMYWGEDRWRWFLMFAAGATGVSGLVRLARRGQPLPLVWFAGCYAIALLGLGGLPVPVWWRFLLLCQIPLALGTAVVLRDASRRFTRYVVAGTLLFSLVFKLATLTELPTTLTYWGSPLQSAYALGQIIPPGPGLVASDPFTSLYVPAATGHRVLTVTKAHVGSQAELNASDHGYLLLHHLYTAPDSNWWPAAQALWRAGVRYVLVEKNTSLAPATLDRFSTGPTPLVRTAADARLRGRMFYRLGRVGALLHSDPEYVLYVLRGPALGATVTGAAVPALAPLAPAGPAWDALRAQGLVP